MHERHNHRTDTNSESVAGAESDSLAGAELDPLGVNRVIVGPRRLEHLPYSDPGADFDPDAADRLARIADRLGVPDPGEHFDVLTRADAAARIVERAKHRTESHRAFVRRLKRSALLQRLRAGRAGGDRSGAAAAAAGRRAGVDAATARLIRAGI